MCKSIKYLVYIITIIAHSAVQKTELGTIHNSHWIFWKNVNVVIIGWALGQAPQGSGHSTEPAGVQEAFGQGSQIQGLIFG